MILKMVGGKPVNWTGNTTIKGAINWELLPRLSVSASGWTPLEQKKGREEYD